MPTHISARLFRNVATALSLLFVAGLTAAASEAKPQSLENAYPLKTCIVSGEELGGMGKPFDYIHKEEGKPDRLVRFCCKMCLKDFKKDPAKYLAKIDAAAAANEKKP